MKVRNYLPIVFLTKYATDRIKQNEIGRACGAYGEMRVTQRIFKGVSEVWKLLGIHSPKWENNIKMIRKEIGLVGRGLDRSVSEQGQK
jgi:hypothetical protein